MNEQKLDVTYPALMMEAQQANDRKEAVKVIRKAKELNEISWVELWGQKWLTL